MVELFLPIAMDKKGGSVKLSSAINLGEEETRAMVTIPFQWLSGKDAVEFILLAVEIAIVLTKLTLMLKH